MDEKSLYAHILNLTDPWQVKSLSLDEKASSVTVIISLAENMKLSCQTCDKFCPAHDVNATVLDRYGFISLPLTPDLHLYK